MLGRLKQVFSRRGLLSFVEGYLIAFWTVFMLYAVFAMTFGLPRGVGAFGLYFTLGILWLCGGLVLWVVGVDYFVGRLFRWLGGWGRKHLKAYTVLIMVLSMFWVPALMLVSLYLVRSILVKLFGIK